MAISLFDWLQQSCCAKLLVFSSRREPTLLCECTCAYTQSMQKLSPFGLAPCSLDPEYVPALSSKHSISHNNSTTEERTDEEILVLYFPTNSIPKWANIWWNVKDCVDRKGRVAAASISHPATEISAWTVVFVHLVWSFLSSYSSKLHPNHQEFRRWWMHTPAWAARTSRQMEQLPLVP